MTQNDDADALIFECEMLFDSAEKDPASISAIEAKVRQIIAAAERSATCPRIVIYRLRKRLEALLDRLASARAAPTHWRPRHG